ncbi:MAG TPA: hypothetical protein VMG10_18460 [Gemmataceae bacterium]|nr:hypothetical protein [Gemmataceae bacterium]
MHDIFSRDPDPLDGMLCPPSPTDDEALRQMVYTRTRRVLHRRRRLRQFAYAAGLLLSFAVGAGAMRLTISGERGRVSAPSSQTASESSNKPLGALTRPRSPQSDDSALTQEWIAFDSEDHRGELYRQAGDRYMTEENDLQSALRCFSNALDNGAEEDLAISSDDSWLLMAIKDARQKEKKHAKQGG